MMTVMQLRMIQISVYGCLVGFVFLSIYSLLQCIWVRKRRRNRFGQNLLFGDRMLPPLLLKLFWIPSDESKLAERQQLLIGCGLLWDARSYFLAKRMLVIILCGFGIGGMVLIRKLPWLAIPPSYLIILTVCGFLLLLTDKMFLEMLKRRRSHWIIKEVYTLSSQLLYYSDSKMNLHAKLSRCVPYTRKIRTEINLLINEWYEDAEMAINRFKARLGTEEGHSFGETLNSLRLHDHEQYYDLLRQRLEDYKEKLELLKDSKKESASYILFIIAGLPILNVFRIFIYPWFAEGQKLFSSLN